VDREEQVLMDHTRHANSNLGYYDKMDLHEQARNHHDSIPVGRRDSANHGGPQIRREVAGRTGGALDSSG
jgi:hypothetical protein